MTEIEIESEGQYQECEMREERENEREVEREKRRDREREKRRDREREKERYVLRYRKNVRKIDR